MALHGNSKTSCQVKKVKFELYYFWYDCSLISARFFNLGKVRASEKQRNRENKIDWSVRKYHNFYKGFLVMVVVVLLSALLLSFFI
jgi:hypothetical protein